MRIFLLLLFALLAFFLWTENTYAQRIVARRNSSVVINNVAGGGGAAAAQVGGARGVRGGVAASAGTFSNYNGGAAAATFIGHTPSRGLNVNAEAFRNFGHHNVNLNVQRSFGGYYGADIQATFFRTPAYSYIPAAPRLLLAPSYSYDYWYNYGGVQTASAAYGYYQQPALAPSCSYQYPQAAPQAAGTVTDTTVTPIRRTTTTVTTVEEATSSSTTTRQFSYTPSSPW